MSEHADKLKLTSLDVSAENRKKLKQLFPSVFVETVDETGKPVESIDFEKLKAELGTFSELFENRRERYGMDWPGKKDCLKLIQQPTAAALKPCREESVDFDDSENLFIEGDNLEVLKLLQKSYYGKVKMIYIDPPYNTGKEFIYPDNYAETLQTYLEYSGQADDEGRRFSTNTPNEGRFHTKWLNLMYPRLYLARNLLQEDGVIFISIDDNEITNMRKLCDEIFGEENLCAQFVWQKKYSRDNRPLIGTTHEYIIMYAKEISVFAEVRNLLPPSEESLKVYKNFNNDPKGRWRPIPLTAQAGHATPSQFYEITTPTGAKHNPPQGRCWSVTKERFDELQREGRIYFGKDGSSQPNLIRYMSEIKGFVPWTWLPSDEVGHTDSAMKEFYNVLGKEAAFETPKPTSLLKHFLQIATNDQDCIIDFFSGTSSTAHAVLDLNKEDGGNRKFIMVQLPEPCDEKSEAFKAGYRTIADIGKERIRRVIKKIEEERAAKSQEAAERLFEEEPQPELDLGFKVFKLDSSNFKAWQALSPDASEQEIADAIQEHLFHIDPASSKEDLLYEILLKSGFRLTEQIESLRLAEKSVYSIAEGALLICLEDDITRELIDAVAEAEPLQFMCLDRGFQGNDQLKANAVQTFNARNQQREKAEQIIFRTV